MRDDLKKQAGASQRSSRAKKNQKSQLKEGETIQLITKDLIRSVKVPRKEPPGLVTVLPLAKFQQITSAARIVVKEEKDAIHKAYQIKREEEIKALEERKNVIYKVDESRRKNPLTTGLEMEAHNRTKLFVEKANALKMEQEEEIRYLNQAILEAQCQATRDIQIQEKKVRLAEAAERVRSLDAMMEEERLKGLEHDSKLDEMRRQRRYKGLQHILEQMQQRRVQKQEEQELKEQERQQFRERQEQLNLEEIMAMERKRAEQKQLQEEIERINTEAIRTKQKMKEQQELADEKDREFIKMKMAREAEYEEEQNRIRKEKELETARLRAQQSRDRDHKAEQHERRARRNQEAKDREWRRNEKEQAFRKAHEKAMLEASRLAQVRTKEQCLSREAGREKAEFERILKKQKDTIMKDKQDEEKQHQKAHIQLQGIMQQIQEHKLWAAESRREVLRDADRRTEVDRLKQQRLEVVKEKKLRELRATGLPEKYCKQVERKTWNRQVP